MAQGEAPGHPVRLAFRVSYLGGGFAGSQMQPACRTVEGEFIAACRRIGLFEDWRSARFVFSGRTDRGVHARGQVCAFETPEPARAIAVLNQQLPRDCWCTGSAPVPPAFHPRYDARSRTYRYYFSEPDLDAAAMDAAARLFVGTHDVSRLARIEGHDPVRTVLSAAVRDEEECTVFEVTGESFLWHQVRCMASLLLAVGAGEADAAIVREHLAAGGGPRAPAAPAEGLVLWSVDCGVVFEELPPHPRSAVHLEEVRRHHALMERIARRLAAE
jgi:tRNA pseudouridine38-40 synthase